MSLAKERAAMKPGSRVELNNPIEDETEAGDIYEHAGRGTVVAEDEHTCMVRFDAGTTCDCTDDELTELSVCSYCRAEYDDAEWYALERPNAGRGPNPFTTHDETGAYSTELKQCPCGNTLGRETQISRTAA